MKKYIKPFIIIVLIVALIVTGCTLIRYYAENAARESQFDELRDIAKPTESDIEQTSSTSESSESAPILWELTPDCVGWLTVPDTRIDYPVMQTIGDPEYYLRRDFYGNDSVHGVPFLDARCHVDESRNLIVYGHHMNNGSMFAPLNQYKAKAFHTEHPTIIFQTQTHRTEYRIFAVLREKGTADPEKSSVFHSIDFTNEKSFDHWMKHIQKNALYNTGIRPKYGARFLTLATCEYSQENGRLAVIAYTINE